MLVAAFPKLRDRKFVQLLRGFFRSPFYCALIAALMAVSELFALELPVYYAYLVLGTGCILFAEDTLGIVPIACCGYMTFSAQNNPGFNPETSAFLRPETYLQLAMILALAVILLSGRLAVCIEDLPKKRVPRLLPGFLGLGVVYLIGGAFSGYYAFNTVLFGFVQIVSVAIFYFYFYYTVDWRTVKAQYFAVVFTAVGFGMLAEVIGMYFLPGVVENGVVVRAKLYTGWGVYNNVGCIMAMCMPAPFYFAATKKHGWAGGIAGCLFFLGVLLTQSRSSILFGFVVFLACLVAVLVRAKGREKLWNAVVFAAFAVAVGVTAGVLRTQAAALFDSLIQGGLDDSGRLDIYRRCVAVIREHPVFGVGFYKTPGGLLAGGGTLTYAEAPEGAFIPPRAHNTVLQLLASGGIVAFAVYLWHRAETVILCFSEPTAAKTFIFFSVAALLLTSLLDCNFFNIGPGLLYGVLLACAECTDERRSPFKT